MRAGVAEPPRRPPPSRPGRLTGRGIAAAAGVLVIALVCVRLGFWQLERQQQRDARNAALEVALQLPALQLQGDSLAAVFARPDRYLYRRVRLQGQYQPQEEVVLRGRSLNGAPGVHLVTPLRLSADAGIVLVNRGWVASSDASTVDPRPFVEPGHRTVEGILQPFSPGGDVREALIEVDGETVRTVQRLNHEVLSAAGGARLLPLLVHELPGSAPEPPVRHGIPALDRGPHLGYAFQWFSFAAIAILGFALMFHLSRRSPT